jgi:hypothetical protein
MNLAALGIASRRPSGSVVVLPTPVFGVDSGRQSLLVPD